MCGACTRGASVQRQSSPREGYAEEILSQSCCPCYAGKGEATRWPHDGEKGHTPTHGTAELNSTRREARR
jgi:hypothetical protein